MRPGWLKQFSITSLLLTSVLFSSGYAVIGLGLLLGSLFLEILIVRRLPWRRSPLDWPIGAFIGTFLVSGWLSPFRALAVASVGLGALTIWLSFGQLYRELDENQNFLTRFLQCWFAGGILAAIWALLLHFLTGRPAYTPAVGQNAVATTLLMSLILGMSQYATAGRWWRLIILAGCGVIGLGLLFTFTRGAWLGFFAAAVALTALNYRRQSWQALAAVLLVGFLGLLAAPVAQRAEIIRRAREAPNIAINKDRIRLVRAGLSMWRDHPLFGTGMNTFALMYPQYRAPDAFAVIPPTAHNLYVNMAAEGGVLGAVSFTSIVALTVLLGWKWRKGAREDFQRVQSVSIFALLIGVLVNQVFDATLMSVHIGVGLWFMAAVVAACGHG